MLDFIREIITQFGGRQGGSQAETDAQNFFAERLRSFCNTVEVHVFREYLSAHFSSLKLFCFLYLISLILFFSYPWPALVVATITAVLFQGHFVSYGSWLDFLYKPTESRNVVGTIEPKKTAQRTLYLTAHMDSTPEFVWWYRLKNIGGLFTLLGSAQILFFPVVIAFGLFSGDRFASGGGPGDYAPLYIAFYLLSPMTLSLAFVHGIGRRRIVPGAMDNLSGVSTIYHAGRILAESDNRLEHTRIRIIAFGSEEAGLKGSKAFVKEFGPRLKEENALVVNCDGLLKKNDLHIVWLELNTNVVYPKAMTEKMARTFESLGVRVRKGIIPIGATDGTSFARAGIPTVTLVAQKLYMLVKEYHTRLDRPEFMEEAVLTSVRDILVKFAGDVDAENSGN